jgi:AraC family transcriptional regulator
VGVAFLPSRSTYGRSLTQRDIGGLAFSVGVHAPGETIPAHRHEDEFQWCLTLEGGFEETAGGRQETCGAGSVLIRPPDCVHADRFAARRGVCLNLFPQRSWLAAHGFDLLADSYAHARSSRLLQRGRELALELRSADAAATLAIEALTVELLESVLRLEALTRRGGPRWLAIAVDEIESDPAAELRLAGLARTACVSAGHLARAFRSAFGQSVGEYVRERRLQRAAALMRDSKRPLAEIAASVGFYDQAHFSRAFKTRFGASPAIYRKTAG